MTDHTPPAPRGRLLLIPNTLDLGCIPDGTPWPDVREVLPHSVLDAASQLTHWIAENAKTTRAFIKRVEAVRPLQRPVQEHLIQVLPRPDKGRPERSRAGAASGQADAVVRQLLAPALDGHDVGLISEAGLPAVADPGAAVVLAAHRLGIPVLALAGPSSLMLALAASGLQGQSFAFVGYLPVDQGERQQKIRELEQWSRKQQQTQLAIETPYRNPALWQALLDTLQPDTLLSVSCGLTLPDGWSRTDTVARWRQATTNLPTHIPAVFAWLARG